MQASFVLDALEQALYARQPAANALIHHSDRGNQYLSIHYTERLAEADIQPPMGKPKFFPVCLSLCDGLME